MRIFHRWLAGLFILCLCLTASALSVAAPLPPQERSDTRIVGGYEATPGAWPWMAALVKTGYSVAQGQYCGGALIHPDWVITAGHCVEDNLGGVISPSELKVYMGLHDLRDTEGIEQIAVKRIIQHHNFGYIGSNPDNDIALLELEQSSSFQIIPVVPQNDPQNLTNVGVVCRVTGWGALSEGGSSPYTLQEVQVPVQTVQEAIDAYGASNVTDAMLPAGYPNGGLDACQGDSGGPLMVPSADGTGWVLAGLVSWGNGCARPGIPGMYTRLSEFTNWIGSYEPSVITGYAYEAYIPYVSYMGDQWTGLALSNIANQTANKALVEFYENDGDLVGSFELNLAARGQWSDMVSYATGSAGWVRVLSERPLKGLSLLGGPEEKPMYDVDMQDSTSQSILAGHFDLGPGRWDSTLMACNPSNSPLTLTFKLYRTDGTHLTPDVTRAVPAMGAAQIKINELYPSHTTTGSLLISASGNGAAAFLLYDGTQSGENWRAGLSALPQ